jgi:hypothetical protein
MLYTESYVSNPGAGMCDIEDDGYGIIGQNGIRVYLTGLVQQGPCADFESFEGTANAQM